MLDPKQHAIFKTAEEFEDAANHYFADCEASGEPLSISGLQIALKKYGPSHRTVTRDALQRWFNGETCEYLQDVVNDACLRIAHYVETDPRFEQKGMTTVAIFLLKQKMLGGLTDRDSSEKQKVEVVIKHDETVEESDFQ